ncbi:MAG TPA: xanthan lyase [Verrucomicrobiales bacterium]|nr:xanthan lyase [Verrucomicrobiales bacterium]
MNPFIKQLLCCLAAVIPMTTAAEDEAQHYDVVVYGGTPGGITAAIAASREGSSVILLEQTKHVGGLSTSGLNRDELEHMDRRTMGGLSEQFVNEAARRSRTPIKPPGPIRGPRVWQSHVAEKVFLEMLKKGKVPVRFEQLLKSVRKKDGRITDLTVRGGKVYQAKVFIDATYEGDLMAAAGVSYTVGREARDTYGESLAGVRYLDEKINVSPYDDQGNLLPGIMPGPLPKEFSASPHPICYNIRLNLSTNPENSVPINKPENYDPTQYELLARSLASGDLKRAGQIFGFYGMPGGKRECNNCQFSIVSMSMPGEQTAWAEASFEQREKIHKKYRDYTHGLLWFLKSDPRVPEKIRKEMSGYGFCKDEWTDNDHWPWYIYVRAARRMKGPCILTQADTTQTRDKKDVIHIGSHFIDSHHVTRYAVDKDHFINEGRIWQKGQNFDIPYRAITPKAQECQNLLVPVCVSSSAVAFCAIRLEPTWMHLGEVSGMAASMAIRQGTSVQGINVPDLQKKITQAGIPLEVPESEH